MSGGMKVSETSIGEETFCLFNELLDRSFGLSFPESRKTILEARLRPRMRELHLTSFMDYYCAVQADCGEELMRLATLATNNETFFFRERYQFENLFSEGLKALEDGLAVPGQLRILCAGCSSGEEPLTLSFYAAAEQTLFSAMEPRIDAFDIDRTRIASARRGVFRQRSLREMTVDQTHQYLIPDGHGDWRVKPQYLRMTHFRQANIIDLHSFMDTSPYDVVFCRNVLIYFSEAALRIAIENFAAVLRPGGILFLGPSESIIGMSPHFSTIRLGDCIAYRRIDNT